MTYAFSHREIISLSFSIFFSNAPPHPLAQSQNPNPEAQIPALRLKNPFLRLKSPNYEAQIPAMTLKCQPQGSNPSLKAHILVLRLKNLCL